MSFSRFRKGFQQRSPVATGTGDDTTNTSTQFLLNKDYFTSEWKLRIISTQPSTVAATGAHVLQAIKSVTLEFSGGKRGGNGQRVNISGQELYDLMRINDNVPVPLTTFTATLAKVEWTVDIYAALAGAYDDFMTGVYTAEFSQIKLTVNWNSYATAAIFSGGTLTGTTVTHTCSVTAINMPVPNTAPGSNSEFLATAQMTIRTQSKAPAAAGRGDDVLLQTGQKLRYLLISSYTAGGVLSDAIVDKVYFNFAGWNWEATFAELKNANQHERGFSETGRAFLDFGDQSEGFLDLTALNEARLKWDALAAGTVRFAEVGMRALNS